MSRVSILIPVFNAENTIELLCSTLITLYGQKYDLQIVLVNDCSRDNSDAICKKLYSDHPTVITYICLSKNFGEHNALMAGMHHVTGDYCVLMDDDLQNPPEEVGKLLDEILKGYDVVYTSYASKKDSFMRNLGSRFNNKVANIIFKKPSGLYLSSFKVINRFLVSEIIKHDVPEPYIDGIILRTTENIGSILVTHRERAHDKSGYSFGKLVSLWGNMVVNFSLLPLRISGIIGLVLILSGLVYGFYKAFDNLYVYGTLTQFETLISMNMFFRGFGLLSLSVLGEYVGRIYLALNKDPQFIIREIKTTGKKYAMVDYLKDVKTIDERR